MVLTNGRVKPLRDILREDDFEDLEFRLAPSMLEGSGRWQKKPQRYAFDEGMGPDPVIDRMRNAWRGGRHACSFAIRLDANWSDSTA